ncbi:hypothetical protein I5Q34_08925 [Streptomyces sp. AV19]|uniref:hypothetical protein n=1 Tax=Streptomyces sp. AV19 TaxID=2793068 RepID=UPI0018FEE3C8|nr:hypothetical protein [Streptomyces sp. AV19]MBH1934409.1 hypothetical protein [Streptomyces sp. AV19]MDG4536263.1 hypothetical protein [Streptomyces sp. AV19]
MGSGVPRENAVPVPDLDDVRFQALVDAAKRALPSRSPAWTDHNVSDPGVTLLEACAGRVDALVYRANRMTPVQRSRLLALMGITPMAAVPLRAVVRFTRTDSVREDLVVPAGTRLTASRERPFVLRTTAPVRVPANGSAAVGAVEQPEAFTEELGVSDGTSGQRFNPSRRPWSPAAPAPVPPLSPLTEVKVNGTVWQPVASFAGAGPETPCYWWDDAVGDVVFGPFVPLAGGGRQLGMVPLPGAPVRVAYTACRGARDGVSPGTELVVSPGTELPVGILLAVVEEVVAPGRDAEDWRRALERAALGLAPSRRAVTAADHERILAEQAFTVSRARVLDSVRPEDPRVPAPLCPPARPDAVVACAVAVRDPDRAVHYYLDANGDVVHRSVPLNPIAEPTAQDDPPEFARKRLDAVLELTQAGPRLWFSGDRCAWTGGEPESITKELPGLPDPFGAGVDAVAAIAHDSDDYEVFFFRDDAFYHRRFSYRDGRLHPSGGRGVRSLIAESFPHLSPHCVRNPDAVVTLRGVFHFFKGPRTESTLWLPEDAALRVLLVPHLPADPGIPPGDADLEVTDAMREETFGLLDGARLLGDRLQVARPDYRLFRARARVRAWTYTRDGVKQAKAAAGRALSRYFHPTAGGPDGRGWPWGRRVHASDVLTALEEVPEIRAVLDAEVSGPVSEVPDNGLVLLRGCDIEVTD